MSNPTGHPSTTPALNQPVAERNTREFLDKLNSSGGKPMETLSPTEARAVLTGAQTSVRVVLHPADVSERTISFDGQSVPLKIVRPAGVSGVLPAFLFFHGGGWVIGDFPTHERFVRDLVHASGAVAIFVDYSLSPEVHYPVAINQAYAALQWVAQHGAEIGVDGSRLAVAGNSAGGNIAASVALQAKLHAGPALKCQVLFWPVTDARFNTESYEQFQSDHFLTREMMKWFWNHYIPDAAQRNEIFASPLQATLDQLRGLPPTLVQTAELDVLRDEGEAYARLLDLAGVEVTSLRVNGMIHDYGLLNPLSHIPAVQAALQQAGQELKRQLA